MRITICGTVAALLGAGVASAPAGDLSPQAMRDDLRAFVDHLGRTHPQFLRYVSRDEWDLAAAAVEAKLGALSDVGYFIELCRLGRKVHDGHTGVLPTGDVMDVVLGQPLPVAFGLFDEGLFIVAASPDHAALAGARVIAIGGRPAMDVLEEFAALVPADNEFAARANAVRLLGAWAIHEVLGGIDGGALPLAVAGPGGARQTVRLERPARSPPSFRGPDMTGWTRVGPIDGAGAPLRDRQPERPYWFEWLPQPRAVYVRFREVRNDGDEPIGEFAGRLFAFIEANDVQRLLIDVRGNGGGNNYLVQPIVHGVLRSSIDRPGRLFVLTDPLTYSAAVSLCARLERETHALFVGDPTGAGPNHCGDAERFELTGTGLTARISALLWQESDPRDARRWIAPDLPAPMTFHAWRAGGDPAIDAAMAFDSAAGPGLLTGAPIGDWNRPSQADAQAYGRALLRP